VKYNLKIFLKTFFRFIWFFFFFFFFVVEGTTGEISGVLHFWLAFFGFHYKVVLRFVIFCFSSKGVHAQKVLSKYA
jgi:hypothetical protein